jgi:hypothetical protein
MKREPHKLIRRLMAMQVADDTSDREFAPRIGVSNGMWSGVKAGERHFGKDALNEIVRLYPNMREDAEAYWLARLELPEVSPVSELRAVGVSA